MQYILEKQGRVKRRRAGVLRKEKIEIEFDESEEEMAARAGQSSEENGGQEQIDE